MPAPAERPRPQSRLNAVENIARASLDRHPRSSRSDVFAEIVTSAEWEVILDALERTDDKVAVIETLRPALADAEDRYRYLVDLILRHGYRIKSFQDAGRADLDKKVLYICHDVHADGIFPSLAVVLVNTLYEKPTDLFVSWRISSIDIHYESGYRCLSHFAGPYARFGLHAFPFLTWLIDRHFAGNWYRYRRWVNSDRAARDLHRLLGAGWRGSSLTDAMTGTEETFIKLAATFRERFPASRSVNHHGELVGGLFKELADRGDHQLQQYFHPAQFLTPQRCRAVGLTAVVPAFLRDYAPELLVFWEGQNLARYDENLRAALETERPIFLLNHPANLMNGRMNLSGLAGAARRFAWMNYPAQTENAATEPAPPPSFPRRPPAPWDGAVIVTGMSRSGTTLLVTVLDAHPDVAMCYDVVPAALEAGLRQSKAAFSAIVDEIGAAALDDLGDTEAYERLRQRIAAEPGIAALSWMIQTCRRSNIPATTLLEVLDEMGCEGVRRIDTPRDRLSMAWRILAKKHAATNSRYVGLKLVMQPDAPAEIFDNASFLTIVRDPRDVIGSHVRLGWDDDVAKLARRWNNFVGRFRKMEHSTELRSRIVKFEDVILRPRETAHEIEDYLGLRPANFIETYHDHAQVFHVKDAFDSHYQRLWDRTLSADAIGAWRGILTDAMVREVERICGPRMREFGYDACRRSTDTAGSAT